jgi:hypothetical protein
MPLDSKINLLEDGSAMNQTSLLGLFVATVNTSLYLSDKRFSLLQAEAELFRRNLRRSALHCCDIMSLQDAAGQVGFDPNAEIHGRMLRCQNRAAVASSGHYIW